MAIDSRIEGDGNHAVTLSADLPSAFSLFPPKHTNRLIAWLGLANLVVVFSVGALYLSSTGAVSGPATEASGSIQSIGHDNDKAVASSKQP